MKFPREQENEGVERYPRRCCGSHCRLWSVLSRQDRHLGGACVRGIHEKYVYPCCSVCLSLACDQRDEKSSTEKAAAVTASYLCETVTEPTSVLWGGDWLVIGLARGGYKVPGGVFRYVYDNVINYVKDCNGILDQSKNSEYSSTSVKPLPPLARIPPMWRAQYIDALSWI